MLWPSVGSKSIFAPSSVQCETAHQYINRASHVTNIFALQARDRRGRSPDDWLIAPSLCVNRCLETCLVSSLRPHPDDHPEPETRVCLSRKQLTGGCVTAMSHRREQQLTAAFVQMLIPVL